MTKTDKNPDPSVDPALQRNNELLERLIRLQTDWKLPLRNGLLSGVGGLVGATLVAWLLVALLKPFERFQAVQPSLDRLAHALERGANKK